jgi:site-specific DNA-methyltransferase (adenine-specific)
MNSTTNGWRACREKLSDNGTIWVSGTYHNIFSVAQMLTELDYKILNCVTWAKTNPPPNLSCRYFTHSTEFIVVGKEKQKGDALLQLRTDESHQRRSSNARRVVVARHRAMGEAQRKTSHAKTAVSVVAHHPRKHAAPCLGSRPFAGSSTTGIAANLLGRRYLGIDKEADFLNISIARKKEISDKKTAATFLKKIDHQSGLGLNAVDIVCRRKCDVCRKRNAMFAGENEIKGYRDLPF